MKYVYVILLLFVLLPIPAYAQEITPLPTTDVYDSVDGYYRAVIMSPDYSDGGGELKATSSDLVVNPEALPLAVVNLPCTQYSGQTINVYSTSTAAAASSDWTYTDYQNVCGNLGGAACAAAMQDKAYYSVSGYVGAGSLVSVPYAYFTGASNGNILPPSEGRSTSSVWGVTAFLDPYTIMDRDIAFPTPIAQTAATPYWDSVGLVGLPRYHGLFNDDYGNTVFRLLTRGFNEGMGKIAKLIVRFAVPKIMLTTLRPVLKVCDRVETTIDLGNPTAIARATATARVLATQYVSHVRPSITPVGNVDPRSFYELNTAAQALLYTGAKNGFEVRCDANNAFWCEIRLDARADAAFRPVNPSDSHCLIIENAYRRLEYLCIGAGVFMDAFNFSARGLGSGDRVRVRCVQVSNGLPCPVRSIRMSNQITVTGMLDGDGLNLAATQTRKAVAATSTRVFVTPTVTVGIIATAPIYATNTATPLAATTNTRTAIAATATKQTLDRTGTAAALLSKAQTATSYALGATNQALLRGSATAQVAQTATAQLFVQQTAIAQATQNAIATVTRGTAIDNNRALAGRDPAIQDAVVQDITGRTSINGLLAAFSSLFTVFGDSLGGSPCLAPVGSSIMGMQLDASGQMLQSSKVFDALCVVRTWLESDTRLIPVIRGIMSAVMLLGFGMLILRYFTHRSS